MAALSVFLLLVARRRRSPLGSRSARRGLEAVPALVRFESLALENDHRLEGAPVSVFEVSLLIDNTTGLALAIEPSGSSSPPRRRRPRPPPRPRLPTWPPTRAEGRSWWRGRE